jgi:hypothetical protein
MKLVSRFYIYIFLSCLSQAVYANDYDNRKLQINASKIVPTIDGIVNPAEWQDANSIEKLVELAPIFGREELDGADIYVKYDSENLYIAAIIKQPKDTIVANQMIAGGDLWADDTLAVTVDTDYDKTNSYMYLVNANSIRYDALLESGSFIGEWDSIWYARSNITDSGWSVEMAIPMQSLSFDLEKSDWGLQFSIKKSAPFRDYYWNVSNPGDPDAWNSSQVGKVSGFKNLDTGLGLDVKTSLTYKEREFDSEDKAWQPSLDVFYKFTPSLNGSLTLNTDFAGTDVDERQVNLSRFSLFIPEKRDFFLQDAGIFEFGGIEANAKPFFSRKIGLSSEGTPLDINAGAKLTGKIGNMNIGLLTVQQDSGVEPEKESLVTVARGRYQLNDDISIGGIFTQGDPAIDKQNRLFGIDYRQLWHADDGTRLEGNFWWQKSDNIDVDSKNQAWGTSLALPGYNWNFSTGYQEIDKNFSPALGFVNRSGIKQFDAKVRYKYRFAGEQLNYIDSQLTYRRISDMKGELLTERKSLRLFGLKSADNDFFSFNILDEFDKIRNNYAIAGKVEIEVGDYNFTRYGMTFKLDDGKKWRIKAEHWWGDFYAGSRKDFETTLTLKPTKHVYFDLDYIVNQIDYDNQITEIRTQRVSINLAYDAYWSWSNRIQHDNVSETFGIFSRIKYEPAAGQFYQFVLSRAHHRDGSTHEIETLVQEISLKLSYTSRF